MKRWETFVLILALVASLAIRIYYVPAPGYEQDIKNFKNWSQASVEHGVHNIYDRTSCDYLPAYLYVLKAVGFSYKAFYPKFNENTYLFNLLVKMPAILADIIISLIIYLFLRKKSPYWTSLAAMSSYAFNPVIILNSAYWGQVDSVSSLIVLIAVLALLMDKYEWAWGFITLGILTKLQLIVLIPILMLVTWKKKGIRAFLNCMAVAWCTFAFILSPFLYFHLADKVINLMFKAVGEYPYLSLYAFNFWWFFSGGNGRWASDTRLFLSVFSYRMLGTLLLAVFFILLLRYLFNKEDDEHAVLFGSFAAVFAFFMLPTEMHERYIIPAFMFLLLAAVKDRRSAIAYGALSLTAFFNLLLALFWTYPKNYPPQLSLLQAFHADIFFSFVNIMVFLFILFKLMRDIKIKYIVGSVAAIVILFAGGYCLKPVHDVYLSDLTPKTYYQEWGQLHMDRSVDGNPLTVNGFKYSKGIGTHARSSTEYILDGRYRSLEGAVGLDDEQKRDNKIEAFIYADNRLIYSSGILQGWIDPKYFRLNIAGAKEIKLVIANGDDGINFDHSDWLGIRALP